MHNDGADRLSRAFQIFSSWQADPNAVSRAALLREHADLREELELLLDDDDEPAGDSATETSRNIGEFEVYEEIGRGGMGVVYEAQQTTLRRRVALKVLSAHLTLEPSAVLRFKREAAAAAKLEHHGIVDVYAVGSNKDAHYFAMELIEGAPLDAVLRKLRATERPGLPTAAELRDALAESRRTASGRAASSASHSAAASKSASAASGGLPKGLPPSSGMTASASSAETATSSDSRASTWSSRDSHTSRAYIDSIVAIVAQVADALHHAHTAGVIHRDVKPSNILVRVDGSAVLTDFGLARESGAPSLTMTGEVAGTPHYIAPEQAAGHSDHIDHRADVFSLGATLYELLTLERAFTGRTTAEIMTAIQERDPKPPQRVQPEIPADLSAVVMCALEKSPDQRYASAADLHEELRAFLDRRPVRARPIGRLRRSWRWAQRNPVIALLASALLVSLLVGLVVTMQKNVALRSAVDEMSRLSDSHLVRRFEDDRYEMPAWHPSHEPRLAAWLKEAEGLLRREPLHRATLADLRERALPYTEADRERDRATHPKANERMHLATDPETAPEQLAALDEELRERRTWRFAEPTDQWQHDTLAALVGDIESMRDPKVGVYDLVKYWHQHVASVREKTLVECADDWRATIEAIGASPKYEGLKIEPQLGLIPLGLDPESGLAEFAHPLTGSVPTRGEDGQLVCAEDCCIVLVLLPGATTRIGCRKLSSEELQDRESLAIPHADPIAQPNEGPVVEVQLDPFFIGKFETTQGQWLRGIARTPGIYNAGELWRTGRITLRHSMWNIHWVQVQQTFHAWGLTMPTEAQWEYAARGGTTSPWWTGLHPRSLQGAENLADAAFAASIGRDVSKSPVPGRLDDGYPHTSEVGAMRANPFGLHDMLGNVSEYVLAPSAGHSVAHRPGDGAKMKGYTSHRIRRGGHFGTSALVARASSRINQTIGSHSTNAGARAARPLLTTDATSLAKYGSLDPAAAWDPTKDSKQPKTQSSRNAEDG